MEKKFEIRMLAEATDFVLSLESAARKKIYYNMGRAQLVNDPELFKKLNNDIWEFRTLYNKAHYRLFAFWDKEERAVVVATHGLIKKTDKTPPGDLERAARIRKQYFNDKIT